MLVSSFVSLVSYSQVRKRTMGALFVDGNPTQVAEIFDRDCC